MTPKTLRKSSLTATAVAVALSAAACGGSSGGAGNADATKEKIAFANTTPAADGQLESATWMMPKEPPSLDLDADAATSQSDLIMSNVCERLMQLQPGLDVQPHLASDYEWRSETELVFTLRDDVVFHDGSPMTADDVVWSMRRHMADDAAESDEFGNVRSVEKTGPTEVTFTMTQSDAVFVQALAGDAGVVLSRKLVEAQGADYGTTKGTDACSGPFSLSSWESGKQVVLTKADDYWNAERAAKTDQITFRWASDDAIVNSLVTGDATGTYLENLSAASRLVQDENITVAQGEDTRVWSMMVTERGGLADVRLRHALSLAFDRQGANQAGLSGLGQPWKEPVGSGAWSYEKKTFEAAYDALEWSPTELSEKNIQQAKELVEEVGSTTPIVVATDGSPTRSALAEAAVSAAESIGLQASIVRIPTAQYSDYYSDPALRERADLFADDYFVSKYDPVGFYKNGASDSEVQWLLKDKEYDALVDQARASTDEGERAEIAIQLSQRWAETMPWISAFSSPATVAFSADVTGVPASGSFRYYPWAADLGSKGN